MRPALPIFAILSLLWVVGGTWLLGSQLCGSSTPSGALFLSDGNFSTTAPTTFSFGLNSAEPMWTDDLRTSMQETGKYLKDNPSKTLNLAGIFGVQESGKKYEDYSNLGEARADRVKAYLMEHGAEESQISISSQSANNLNRNNKEEAIIGGILFQFGNAASSGSGSESGMGNSKIDVSPLDRIFTYSYEDPGFTLQPDADLEASIVAWKAYLDNNPNGKLRVKAYVDRIDDAVKVSEKIATRNRRIFRDQYKFASKQVVAEGMGDADPIASNDTPENRMKNRRVVVMLEK